MKDGRESKNLKGKQNMVCVNVFLSRIMEHPFDSQGRTFLSCRDRTQRQLHQVMIQMNLEAGTSKISESFFAIILLIGFLSFSRLDMNCFVVPSTAASSGCVIPFSLR